MAFHGPHTAGNARRPTVKQYGVQLGEVISDGARVTTVQASRAGQCKCGLVKTRLGFACLLLFLKQRTGLFKLIYTSGPILLTG